MVQTLLLQQLDTVKKYNVINIYMDTEKIKIEVLGHIFSNKMKIREKQLCKQYLEELLEYIGDIDGNKKNEKRKKSK